MEKYEGHFEYEGRLVEVFQLFAVPFENRIKIYAAVKYLLTGQCITVEWKSLRAKPPTKTDPQWYSEHVPIEYFGPKITNILKENNITTMFQLGSWSDTNIAYEEELQELKGVGEQIAKTIKEGYEKWQSDSKKRNDAMLDEIIEKRIR